MGVVGGCTGGGGSGASHMRSESQNSSGPQSESRMQAQAESALARTVPPTNPATARESNRYLFTISSPEVNV